MICACSVHEECHRSRFQNTAGVNSATSWRWYLSSSSFCSCAMQETRKNQHTLRDPCNTFWGWQPFQFKTMAERRSVVTHIPLVSISPTLPPYKPATNEITAWQTCCTNTVSSCKVKCSVRLKGHVFRNLTKHTAFTMAKNSRCCVKTTKYMNAWITSIHLHALHLIFDCTDLCLWISLLPFYQPFFYSDTKYISDISGLLG